jgi:O-succinylbenzoic acid--CoA ligase
MNSLTLNLNGHTISYDWIVAEFDPQSVACLSAWSAAEHTVLTFCRNWLMGQTEFTLPTSGSTGAPKTIRLTRAQMTASAQRTGQALGLQPGERALVCLNPGYIAGSMMLVRGLVLGLELAIVPPTRDPLSGFPAETHFDFTALVPLQLQAALQSAHATHLLNRMRAILIGGAPLTPDLAGAIRQQLTAPTFHTYGMTETVSHVALRRLNGATASDYFVPLPGVALSQDARGCLVIQAGELAQDQTLVTNDVVELRADGQFRWLGRADNIINSGGVKVQAERVEQALSHLPDLAGRRLFVAAQPHPELGQAVIAVIEGAPLPELAAHLAGRAVPGLSRYEIPRQIYFVPHFAETATGKIDRRATLAAAGLPAPA